MNKSQRNPIEVNSISVVIPMYNSEHTITNTIDSVLKQTEVRFIREIIIVNDGSTDNSLNVVNDFIKQHNEKDIWVVSKPNGGVSFARNTGIRLSTGVWIALIDSDDLWIPTKIEIQVKTILENKDIDFLGGDLDDNGLSILSRKINGLYKANITDLCLKNFPQTSTVLFRKEIFDSIGGFDEKQRYAEEGNYFMRICLKFNFYHLPVKVVDYGGGKAGFGDSGLSANLAKMYGGNVKNIKELYDSAVISSFFYTILRVFYFLKYLRRIILTKLRRFLKAH